MQYQKIKNTYACDAEKLQKILRGIIEDGNHIDHIIDTTIQPNDKDWKTYMIIYSSIETINVLP